MGVALRYRKAHLRGMRSVHVVLGAGQIGWMVAEKLLARGHHVRLVRRGKPGPSRPGLTWVIGDITDTSFATQAARGADVVYSCVNAPYDRWPEMLAPLHRGAMQAARANDAKLVVLDNLYMYGRTEGPMREDTAFRPCSKKGEIRARLAEEIFAQKDMRVTSGRASDFYGPGATLAAVFGERFFHRAFAGKAVDCVGDPDQVHSYSYTPDVAEGLITLGTHDEALGQAWHLPVAPAESTRALVERTLRALDLEPRIRRAPDFALKLMGVFAPVFGEVAEMTYQWKSPFVLDDSRFRAAFGGEHTPVEEQVRATVAWAKGYFQAAA
jgi:nucleoside-diphosphate-sugar epimerase